MFFRRSPCKRMRKIGSDTSLLNRSLFGDVSTVYWDMVVSEHKGTPI